jgi:hypothetical protein
MLSVTSQQPMPNASCTAAPLGSDARSHEFHIPCPLATTTLLHMTRLTVTAVPAPPLLL